MLQASSLIMFCKKLVRTLTSLQKTSGESCVVSDLSLTQQQK